MSRDNFSSFIFGKIADMDDSHDIDYWQKQSDLAKFTESWRLVVQAYKLQEKDLDELRFQRSIASLQKSEY